MESFQPYPPPLPTRPKTNSKSIASMVLGILAIILPYIGLILGIIAIVMSKLAFNEINRMQEQGRGMAIAGLVCGIIGTAIYAIIILVLIVVGLFIAANDSSIYNL